jgi:hypothetical protein
MVLSAETQPGADRVPIGGSLQQSGCTHPDMPRRACTRGAGEALNLGSPAGDPDRARRVTHQHLCRRTAQDFTASARRGHSARAQAPSPALDHRSWTPPMRASRHCSWLTAHVPLRPPWRCCGHADRMRRTYSAVSSAPTAGPSRGNAAPDPQPARSATANNGPQASQRVHPVLDLRRRLTTALSPWASIGDIATTDGEARVSGRARAYSGKRGEA